MRDLGGGGFGAGRRPGGGAADAGGARGFRRSRNGLRPGAGDFLRDLGGEGLGRAAGPAAEPPTQPKGLRAPAEGGGGLRPDPGGCEKTALTGGGQGGGYGWE